MDSIQAISSFFVTFAQVCGVFAVWTVAAFIIAARREAAICAVLANAVAVAHLERWTIPDVSEHLEEIGQDAALNEDSENVDYWAAMPDLTADLEEITVTYETRIARDNRPYIVALVKGKRAEIIGWFARSDLNVAIEMCEILNG